MAGNVELTWKNPVPTARQLPIKHTLIEARVSESLPWGPIATVAAPTEVLLIEQVAPGDWFYQATWFDTALARSTSLVAVLRVGADAPSAGTNFKAVEK